MSPSESRWPPERCSALARVRHDPMLGTAFPAGRLLLVEQPYPWDSEGLRTSRFDRETALALEARAREERVRVQAIRRPGAPNRDVDAPRRWAIVDTRDQAASVHWGTYTEDAELLDLPLDGSTGTHDEAPIYLVCTHGSHDPCCGEHGRSIVKALAAARPDQVWQTSHLGGCRFAPTVLVLPIGVMYGRVPPSAVAELVAATEERRVVVPYLRGRIGLPPPTQAAVGFAHEELELPGFHDLSPVSTTAIDEATFAVRIETPRGPFDVTVERHRVDAEELTCAHPVSSWFRAHRGLSIAPV